MIWIFIEEAVKLLKRALKKETPVTEERALVESEVVPTADGEI